MFTVFRRPVRRYQKGQVVHIPPHKSGNELSHYLIIDRSQWVKQNGSISAEWWYMGPDFRIVNGAPIFSSQQGQYRESAIQHVVYGMR